MKRRKKSSFAVEVFLSTVNGGRSLENYRKSQTVFSRGSRRIPSSTFRKARSS
jgi:hypothetical protein